MGWFFGILAVFVIMFGMDWAIEGNSFLLYKFFAPKQEQVRRQVFEQTKSYNQGTIQELQNMQFQYYQANKEQKDALADIILHRAADYNMDDPHVPAELREFVDQLRTDRENAR